MPFTEKPSNPEDEYFAKEDLEKIKRLRAQRDQERQRQAAEQQRMQHWMKCPKCGADLKETKVRDVAVDICTSCRGVWLDRGELELLTGGQGNILKRVIQSFREELNYEDALFDKPGAPQR